MELGGSLEDVIVLSKSLCCNSPSHEGHTQDTDSFGPDRQALTCDCRAQAWGLGVEGSGGNINAFEASPAGGEEGIGVGLRCGIAFRA